MTDVRPQNFLPSFQSQTRTDRGSLILVSRTQHYRTFFRYTYPLPPICTSRGSSLKPLNHPPLRPSIREGILADSQGLWRGSKPCAQNYERSNRSILSFFLGVFCPPPPVPVDSGVGLWFSQIPSLCS
ncbi:hypothetical protein JTE90_018683 [Oedothorax gibbosus]|uniref:Uncharacterized protein n=1 Tax=Oedothorax gibbosus TaxID=931172 RepID=A0AAV6V1L4_9ARAC|nr:hypothetical protein JTE90_018683 [Oedothorax gibbosus]